MLKLVVAALVLGLGFFFLHHRHGSSVGRVSSCLEKSGASVKRSTLVEDIYTAAAAEQGETLPEQLRKAVREIDKNLYEASYGSSSALLIFTRGGRRTDTIEAQLHELSELSGLGPAQRFGGVLVLWTEPPSDAASAAVSGCLS